MTTATTRRELELPYITVKPGDLPECIGEDNPVIIQLRPTAWWIGAENRECARIMSLENARTEIEELDEDDYPNMMLEILLEGETLRAVVDLEEYLIINPGPSMFSRTFYRFRHTDIPEFISGDSQCLIFQESDNAWWLNIGCGLTSRRENAYVYTVDAAKGYSSEAVPPALLEVLLTPEQDGSMRARGFITSDNDLPKDLSMPSVADSAEKLLGLPYVGFTVDAINLHINNIINEESPCLAKMGGRYFNGFNMPMVLRQQASILKAGEAKATLPGHFTLEILVDPSTVGYLQMIGYVVSKPVEHIPEKGCKIVEVMTHDLIELLKAAPANPTVRALVSKSIQTNLPDSIKTFNDAKDWIEKNVNLADIMMAALVMGPPLRRRPARHDGFSVNVAFQQTEIGSCHYSVRSYADCDFRFDRDDIIDAIQEANGCINDAVDELSGLVSEEQYDRCDPELDQDEESYDYSDYDYSESIDHHANHSTEEIHDRLLDWINENLTADERDDLNIH